MVLVKAIILFIAFIGSFLKPTEGCNQSQKPCGCRNFNNEILNFVCVGSYDILKDIRRSADLEYYKLNIEEKNSLMKKMPDNYFQGLKVHYLHLAGKELIVTRNSLNGTQPFLRAFGLSDTNSEVIPDLSEFKNILKLKFQNAPKLFSSSIDERSMIRLPKEEVNTIIISKCGIKSISESALKNFKKLTLLDLSANLLTNLPDNPFPDKLLSVELWGNKFNSFPGKTFINSKNLKRIDLLSNNISNLHEHQILPLMERGCTITLHGGYINCSCKLAWIGKLNENPDNTGILHAQCRDEGKRRLRQVMSLKVDDFSECS